MPVSLLAIVKTGLLFGAVVILHYGGATKLLIVELELPAMSSQTVMSGLCNASAPSANESADEAKKIDLSTPIIEAAYREMTTTSVARASLAQAFRGVKER